MRQLRAHAEGLWTAEDPTFRVMKVGRIGTRMVVVRLRDRRLVLISPIELTDALVSEIGELGEVGFILCPNRVHHLFAQAAKSAFPAAALLAAPGLPEKRSTIPFEGVIGSPTSPAWSGDLESQQIHGFPFLNEVVFFHVPTRTLILTDLCFNVRRGNVLDAIAFRLNDMWQRFGPSRAFRLLIRDRAALRESVESILRWDFDRVIVAHGDVLERGGPEALRRAFSFL